MTKLKKNPMMMMKIMRTRTTMSVKMMATLTSGTMSLLWRGATSHAGMPKYYRRDGTAEGNDKQASNATRRFFDGEESCYIIDANLEGNVGRYLKHSCHPNLFAQNVFVDTHDLRFPWVAFFTSKIAHQSWYRTAVGLYKCELGVKRSSRILNCRCDRV